MDLELERCGVVRDQRAQRRPRYAAGPGREMEVEPHRFDPSGARRVDGGSEVVVHMEQDHPLEHWPDELREWAFAESRDDMRVTDVEAHADVLACEPSNEFVHGARAVADVL